MVVDAGGGGAGGYRRFVRTLTPATADGTFPRRAIRYPDALAGDDDAGEPHSIGESSELIHSPAIALT